MLSRRKVVRWTLAGVALVALGATGCTEDSGGGGDGGAGGGMACGNGTHEDTGVCVADAVDPGLTCGTGTHEESGACVADGGSGGGGSGGGGLSCGAGTHEEEGACVADGPATLVQTGTLVVPPAGTPPSGWFTETAVKLGVSLETQYDSSGPDAWDPAAHPLVFATSVGPGYGGQLGGTVKWPGAALFDAETHELVTYAAFDFTAEGWDVNNVVEPHGLGASPDGKWLYIPTGKESSQGRLLIVNARTMKLDKVLALRGRPHHIKSYTDRNGKPLVLAYGWAQPPFVLDPADDNKVVGGCDYNDMGMEGYLYFVDPTGTEMWASGRWRLGNTRAEVHGNILMVVDTETWKLTKAVSFEGESTPVWISFSPDNKFVYASGGHSSMILKYDRELDETLGIARAGVEGPYGLILNWDGTEIYSIGKGEGSHNLGKDIGRSDTVRIESGGNPLGNYTTDCVRGDHATLHPDPAKNEIWVSCNSSFELAVFNLDTKEVTARIPMPSSGSTHSGAFVRYGPTFAGEVVSDQNGLHGDALATQASMQAPAP